MRIGSGLQSHFIAGTKGGPRPSPDERAIGLCLGRISKLPPDSGLALRFVGAFSPKTTAALSGCQLELVDGQLIFRAPAARETMMSEMPRKRFASLARRLKRTH